MDETVPKYLNIRPPTTGIRSVDPNNVTRLDTNAYLISQTRPLELVRVPLFIVRMRLPNLEVRAINCDLASLSSVPAKAIGPMDLYKGKSLGVQSQRNKDIK